MGLDVMHVNEEILEQNLKIISESFKENNAASWFVGACRSAITDDPVLGLTFDSYYAFQTYDVNDEINN